ncbi:MAG: alpha/beta fold hydrolase [Acidimicrobiales bacterium]
MLAALALLAPACGLLGRGDDAATTDPPDTAAPDTATTDGAGASAGDGADPAFEEGPCPFDAPAGTEPRCGTVAVPEDWATGTGTVTLSVAVFPSTADSPAPDPIVYLDGGPGGHSLDAVQFLTADLLEPLQARSEVVFFDQRGVGHSAPALDCTEVTAFTRQAEDDPAMDDDEATAGFDAALTACRRRLAGDGIDLAAYNSINNAHDVDAIRRALGYDTWNMLGISYGTRLGLEVMRQHPDGLRSVVLDSVYPPEVDSTRDNPASFVAAYQAVVAACAQEPACAAGGDLAARYAAVVAALDAQPIQVEVRDFLTAETDQVWVDGAAVIDVVSQALYSPDQFTDLPELVAELEAGRTDALELFLSQNRTNEAFFSTGMFFAVECNEEIAFADPAAVAAALPPDPFGHSDTFDYGSNNGSLAFSSCAAFNDGTTPVPDPILNQPVSSDLPTLVMSGRYDPVTPPAWAEEAAGNLTQAWLITAPYGAHGISPGRCGMSVVRQFLDDPDTVPDSTCFDTETLSFLAGPDPAPVELEPVTYTGPDGSATISTVAPRGWSTGGLDGDWVRQSSFLDPTELLQLGGSGGQLLAASIEQFLTETQDVTLSAPETVEGPGGPWQYRTARTDTRAVEWYQAERNGVTVLVLLVAAPAEVETLTATVLQPALDNITVTG